MRMTKTLHIIFGNDSHKRNYARAMAVNPLHVVVATRPDLIHGYTMTTVDTIKVIRFPEDVWKPTTFPCEKRVAETEAIIKSYQKLGITIVEVAK